jgi:hypothetical protein
MKMFFSTNKRGIQRNNQEIIINPQNNTDSSKDEQKELFIANAYSLKYGMFARIQNSTNCSNCGK